MITTVNVHIFYFICGYGGTMLKSCYTILLVFVLGEAQSSVFTVGSSGQYATPNELYKANVVQKRDTIEIDAEEYSGTDALAHWSIEGLLIKGVNGRPHLKADGENIMGKGIWVVSGDSITVDNIEFSGSQVPDQNGAGIRLEGLNDTIRNCSFHHNQNGILANNPYEGDVVIEYSEFGHSGAGDGYTHNIYIGHYKRLYFRHNYSHHADVGHVVKSRADENYILYNRMMDEESGASSRLLDLPNGGYSLIMGNVFMQGENAPNSNLVGYGKEGLENDAPHEMHFINNTLVNKRTASGLFVDVHEDTERVNIVNNIFAGSGVVYKGPSANIDDNFVEIDIAKMHFEDESQYNYQLTEASPVIDIGTPLAEIFIPTSFYSNSFIYASRVTQGAAIDRGAFEFSPSQTMSSEYSIEGLSSSSIERDVESNPTNGSSSVRQEDSGPVDVLSSSESNTVGLITVIPYSDDYMQSIDHAQEVTLFNALGSVVLDRVALSEFEPHTLSHGIYLLHVKNRNGTTVFISIAR